MDLIQHYFPKFTERQLQQFRQLQPLYEDWNEKINVISRKDIQHLYLHHVLHSLAIAKLIQFKPGTQILDLGTGGGFPGIPLAIRFPNTQFHLVDSIGKKIKVVAAVSQALELSNVTYAHVRAEEVKQQFDFVVTRAVANTTQLKQWTKGKYKKQSQHKIPNGLIALKGGNIKEELKEAKIRGHVTPITNFFKEDFYKEKYLVHVKFG